MKILAVALALALTPLDAAEIAVGPIELVGYILAGPEGQFALFDPTSKETTSWVKLGGSWNDYRATSFDASREILTVTKGAEVLHLRLRDSKIADSKAPRLLKGSSSLVGDAIIYSADAELAIGNNIIRADGGTMAYYPSDNTIRGDLAVGVVSSSQQFIAKGGVLKLGAIDGKFVVTSLKSIIRTKPNQAPEPTAPSGHGSPIER